MKPEYRPKFLEEQKRDDLAFKAVLLRDIPYFHQLYRKYNDSRWLELAKALGSHAADLKMREYYLQKQ